jgi:SAM-dependent methyltransferase
MDPKFYQHYFELERDNWWFRVRRNILKDLLEKYTHPKAKIFDFGCGSGYTVNVLQKWGYDARGGDASPEAIAHGIHQGIKGIVPLENQKVPLPENSFDVVLTLDVIEHIKDESSIVEELKRLVAPGGKIIAFVPAYQWLWGVQDEVAHHYRRYTATSFAKLFGNNSNLEILRITYFNTFLFPPIAAVRLINRFLKPKNRNSDFDIQAGVLSPILYMIFNVESFLMRYLNFPFGVSIMIVAQKK